METNIDQTKWYDRILASFIFFTRLPFWRLHQPPKECYKTVVEHWPLTGWLTGGLMAATLWVGSMHLPYMVAVLLAIVVRLMVTGALHEDGLADFLDGFGGGGSDRARILSIMKDSHIGTYGVVGLLLYHLLLAAALISMTPTLAALSILAGDDDALCPHRSHGQEPRRLSQAQCLGGHQPGRARTATHGFALWAG